VHESAQQVLCIRIGDRHCSFAIVDKAGTNVHCLGYYTAHEINGEVLATLFMSHSELSRNFYSVQVGFDTSYSLLMPVQFYDADTSSEQLRIMNGAKEELFIITENVREWQLYNIYGIRKDVHQWMTRRFPAAILHHNYSVRIKLPAGAADRLLVDVHSDEFSIIAIKGNKLVIAQTYSYSSHSDILYYLLKICEQYNFSQRETELCIAGLIEKKSALYHELTQYFLNLAFREPTWEVPGMDYDEYSSHFFTPLNDLARCVS